MPDWPTRRDFLITVQYEATRAGLDPQLVLGLIQHESNFRKYAVSGAGARGFMQVMPFWVRQIGNSGHDLFTLRTNLRYGCTILRYYLDIEQGDLYRALGRYNGSLGRGEYPNCGARVDETLLALDACSRLQRPRRAGSRRNQDPELSVELRYRGRFAPSPSGPLHFGSLVAAMASWCDARASKGDWLVRIEDVDQTRSRPGASDAILATLEAYGFEWDGPVVRQSERAALYAAALDDLIRRRMAFACACTRRELELAAPGKSGERVYPGTCRQGLPGRSRRPLLARRGHR